MHPNRPHRQKGKRPPAKVIRIHTEGEITERDYIDHWNKKNNQVTFSPGSYGHPPQILVSKAISDMRENQAKSSAKKRYDEIWCVFDKNTHPNLEETVSKAKKHGIRTAISNPCFELWLVLHYENQTSYISSSDIQKRAQKLRIVDAQNKKEIRDDSYQTLTDEYEVAKERAIELDKMHERNDSPKGSNPSSNVWKLVERLKPESGNSTP